MAADAGAIQCLLMQCFDESHKDRNIWALRVGVPLPELCLVAEGDEGGGLLGSIRYWPITIAGVDSLLLGPLAVAPAVQGQGIGRALVRASLEIAKGQGRWRWCFVSGMGAYYIPLGFTKISADMIDLPAPIEDERLHLLDFSANRAGISMPYPPWVVRPQGVHPQGVKEKP